MESRPQPTTIGERLTCARERAGLTRSQLEAELKARGVTNASVMTIRRNEAGTRSPTVEELVALSAIAGVTTSWLIEGADPTPETFTLDERSLVLGHLQAELARQSETDRPDDRRAAFERVERRVERLRAAGELGDGAWAYWCALREGAVLAGALSGPPFAASEEECSE